MSYENKLHDIYGRFFNFCCEYLKEVVSKPD